MVVAVILGSVRSGRMGLRVARWTMAELKKRGHEATLVDPAALGLPLLEKVWKEVKESDAQGDAELKTKLRPLAELYAKADGFCIVSAEYNNSIPPALSNLLDYFVEEYAYKASAIVCYSGGPYGGIRAAMQLRALLSHVGMPSIPTLWPVPLVESALSEEGVALTQAMAEKAGGFLDQFEWYMRALKAERERGVPK